MKTAGIILAASAVLAVTSGVALAANTPVTATNANTVSGTLAVKATLVKAVQLTLNTGSGCTVSNSGGGDFSLDFGSVDALGISAGCTGAGAGKFTATVSGVNKAVYYTDYTITPNFSNQSSASSSTLGAYVSSAFSQSGFSIVQSVSAPSAFSDLTAMSTSSGAPTNMAGSSSNIVNNTAITRYVGVLIDGASSNAPSGSSSTAVITYTLTIQ